VFLLGKIYKIADAALNKNGHLLSPMATPRLIPLNSASD
jgi:hypothetical protein